MTRLHKHSHVNTESRWHKKAGNTFDVHSQKNVSTSEGSVQKPQSMKMQLNLLWISKASWEGHVSTLQMHVWRTRVG